MKLLKGGRRGNTSFAPIIQLKSYILFANDNTYMANQRMKACF